jgi:predicted nucleic acid-binding protein
MSLNYTLDTGALIALERRQQRMARFWAMVKADGLRLTVPAVVVAEWWRAQSARRDEILRSVTIDSLTTPLAKLAGEALAVVSGATLADAIVVASAAQRGDGILTSDVLDLERLRVHFTSVPCVLHV